MGVANWTYCPMGQWTHVSSLPVLFFHVNIWSSSGSVFVRWRRYMDALPWYSEGQGTLNEGQNKWVVPPAAANTWWFYPERDCVLRMT